METGFSTTSWITCPQLTMYSPHKDPKMVLPISLVTLPGFSGYRIRTTNSSTLFSLGSMQSLTACPSLGLMSCLNFPSTHIPILPVTRSDVDDDIVEEMLSSITHQFKRMSK